MNVNDSYDGVSIEKRLQKIMQVGEPITDGAPLIYTERKDGVQPQYDIRTDRFETALNAVDKRIAQENASREEMGKIIEMDKKDKGGKQDGKAGSTDTTTSQD